MKNASRFRVLVGQDEQKRGLRPTYGSRLQTDRMRVIRGSFDQVMHELSRLRSTSQEDQLAQFGRGCGSLPEVRV